MKWFEFFLKNGKRISVQVEQIVSVTEDSDGDVSIEAVTNTYKVEDGDYDTIMTVLGRRL
jgi:hypothetical protein